MRIDVVTIFPDYLAPLRMSLLGRAGERGLVDLHVHDLRTWTSDVHRTVDDAPYGGGPGMVMRPEPWGAALDAVLADGAGQPAAVPAAPPPEPAAAAPQVLPRLVVPTPSGRRFDQVLAIELAAEPWLTFACGRYEGIDARVAQDAATRMPVDEVSIGDYVLAGGEVAVLVMVEAVTRLLPGVLGNTASAADDSFAPGPMAGLLEGPVYTRPLLWRGREVPAVLRSGDHAAVARWRREQAVRRTAQQRPDLFAALPPDLRAQVGPDAPELPG